MMRVLRSLRNRLLGCNGVVLLYRHVAEPERDPECRCVTPQHFAEHMAVLRERFRPAPLMAMGAARLPARTVAVTFDAGYARGLHVAAPLLAEHSVPATVFVATAYMNAGREFERDALEQLLLTNEPVPNKIELRWHGKTKAWHIFADTPPVSRKWNVLGDAPDGSRQAAYKGLCEYLRPLTVPRRFEVVDALFEQAGRACVTRNTHRPLTPDEVIDLDRNPMVTVGSQGLSHVQLSALDVEDQLHEIMSARRRLEELLGHVVDEFSYPYGGSRDIDDSTIALVREAEFRIACTSEPGLVRRSSDRLQLPRFAVCDWDGHCFADRLERWFCGKG